MRIKNLFFVCAKNKLHIWITHFIPHLLIYGTTWSVNTTLSVEQPRFLFWMGGRVPTGSSCGLASCVPSLFMHSVVSISELLHVQLIGCRDKAVVQSVRQKIKIWPVSPRRLSAWVFGPWRRYGYVWHEFHSTIFKTIAGVAVLICDLVLCEL